MSRIFALVSLALAVTWSAAADDLSDLFAAAIESDTQYRILGLTLDSRLLSVERANLPGKLTLKGDAGMAVTQVFGESGATSIALSPGVDIGLAEPANTAIGFDLPVTITLGDTADVEVSPELSVSQPLNELLGLEPSERAERLAELAGNEQARINLLSREAAVQKSVLQSIRTVVAAELAVAESRRNLERATLDHEREEALPKLNREGADYRALVLSLERASRDVDRALQALEKAEAAFSILVGAGKSVPSSIEAPTVALPGVDDADRNPTAYFARLTAERVAAELELLESPFIPVYSAGASYLAPKGTGRSGHTVGGSFSAAFERFSVTAGLRTVINDPSSLTGSLTVSLKLPDDRSKTLLIEEKRNALEVATLQLDQAFRTYESSVDGLAAKIDELELREIVLEEDREIARAKLAEVSERVEAGLETARALETASWNLERLDYTEMLIAVDRYLLAVDIESLTLAGK